MTAKRPRCDPSVAEASAKAKASQGRQIDSLTKDLIPGIVSAAKKLLRGSKVSMILEPKVAQLLLVAEIGLEKCIKLIDVVMEVPVNVPNRAKVVCSLMDSSYCIQEDKCEVYMELIEMSFPETDTASLRTCNNIPRY